MPTPPRDSPPACSPGPRPGLWVAGLLSCGLFAVAVGDLYAPPTRPPEAPPARAASPLPSPPPRPATAEAVPRAEPTPAEPAAVFAPGPDDEPVDRALRDLPSADEDMSDHPPLPARPVSEFVARDVPLADLSLTAATPVDRTAAKRLREVLIDGE